MYPSAESAILSRWLRRRSAGDAGPREALSVWPPRRAPRGRVYVCASSDTLYPAGRAPNGSGAIASTYRHGRVTCPLAHPPPAGNPTRRRGAQGGGRGAAAAAPCRAAERSDPPELPIVARRADLLEMIGAHQVVVVAGETGSGKTTQIPKMCLELGRGIAGMIGHTQPRRIAARTWPSGSLRSWAFPSAPPSATRCALPTRSATPSAHQVMTDGILLAEIAHDPLLRRL